MQKIEKSSNPEIATLSLIGAITESVDWSGDLDSGIKQVMIDCRGITRVNSMGITKWILFFRELRKKKVTLRFSEMPVAVVNLCNFVAGMVNHEEVISLYLPYYCETCSKEEEVLASVEELETGRVNGQIELKEAICPTCKTAMTFDGTPSHYFDFLKPV